MGKLQALGVGLIAAIAAQPAGAFTIDIDYFYDDSINGGNDFFAAASSRSAMSAAASFFEGIISDDLGAITSTGANSFDARFTNPRTGDLETIEDFSIAADTIKVFAGGRDLGTGGSLGFGGAGGFGCGGVSPFCSNAGSRGEGVTSGAGATDFGPWGRSDGSEYHNRNAQAL